MADAEAEGVREAGFEVDMFQYLSAIDEWLIDSSESPRHFRRTFWARCMRPPSRAIPSLLPPLSPNTTPSSLVYTSRIALQFPSCVVSCSCVVGIPTRYGNFPAQWKTFWDSTGSLWTKGALVGKMFGTFVSTGSPGGGQELTAFQSLSVAVHQGMVYIPLGYQISDILNLDEVHGGSPWGTNFSPFLPSLSLFWEGFYVRG